MRKLILVALLMTILLLPARVQAQSGVHFSSVRVEVWPEFDKAAVLVIYHLKLAPEVALPARMKIRIPVKEHAVAYVDENGELLQLSIESTQQGGWVLLTFTAPTDSIQVEYYDTLVTNNAARHVVYQWPGDFATDSLIVNFLQPPDATDLKMNPEAVKSSTDANGLVQYQVDFSSRKAGETASLTVDYQKTTDRLSASLPQVQPSAPLDNNAQGKFSLSAYLPWIVGGAGFLLIVVGLGIGLNYWRGTTGQKSGDRKRHTPRRGENEPDQEFYCPQCGKRAQAGDQFCRTCGGRLRRAE